MKKIQDLKKGEFFKRKEGANKVYVADGFNRSIKKYEAHDFEDISAFASFKKDTLVFVDFEF